MCLVFIQGVQDSRWPLIAHPSLYRDGTSLPALPGLLPQSFWWVFQVELSCKHITLFWVQSSPMPEEPSPCSFERVQCRWLDPFSKEVILSFVPCRPGNIVATWPRNMVILLLCNIFLIYLWPFLSFLLFLVRHTCGPVIFYLCILTDEFWSLRFLVKLVQFFSSSWIAQPSA